jgi:hypothetical protein
VIAGNRFATLAQNIFMKSNSLANVHQSFFAVLALANAAGEARHLCYYIAILAGI